MIDRNAIVARRTRSIGAVIAFAAMVSLAACSSGDDDNASAPSDADETVAVSGAPAPVAETTPSTEGAAAPAAESTPAAETPTPSTEGAVAPAAESTPAAETPAPSTEGAAAPAAESAPAASGAPPAGIAADGAALDAIVDSRQLADWYFAVLVDEAAIADPVELEPIARSFCPETGVCQVGVWYDQERFPTTLPVTTTQLRNEVFGFGRNEAGTEFVLWNCNTFPQFEAERRCLPRAM